MLGCSGRIQDHVTVSEAFPKAVKELAGEGSEVRPGDGGVAMTEGHRHRVFETPSAPSLTKPHNCKMMCRFPLRIYK